MPGCARRSASTRTASPCRSNTTRPASSSSFSELTKAPDAADENSTIKTCSKGIRRQIHRLKPHRIRANVAHRPTRKRKRFEIGGRPPLGGRLRHAAKARHEGDATSAKRRRV